MQTSKSSSTGQNNVVTASSLVAATDDDETMTQAAMLATSIVFPMIMQAATELGLLEIISGAGHDGQLTAEEVAGKLPVKENPQAADMVERILRHLVAFSVVSCSVKARAGGETRRVYGLTAVGRYFVKDEEGVSMVPLMRLTSDKVFLDNWYKLKDVVLEGGSAFDKVHGMNTFEYPAVDNRFNKDFNLAMFNYTTILMKKVLRSYNGFENIDVLVDVGGGLGHTLNIILSKYPNMRGINFDLPHVTKHGLSHPGMEHKGGDMFEGVPSAEAIFMKWILHDWSDGHCLKLLKNCHKAIPENGKVIVIESVVSEQPETSTTTKAITMMDLIMMTQTPGGMERTKNEFIALAMAAGFEGIRFESYVGHFWVMELYK